MWLCKQWTERIETLCLVLWPVRSWMECMSYCLQSFFLLRGQVDRRVDFLCEKKKNSHAYTRTHKINKYTLWQELHPVVELRDWTPRCHQHHNSQPGQHPHLTTHTHTQNEPDKVRHVLSGCVVNKYFKLSTSHSQAVSVRESKIFVEPWVWANCRLFFIHISHSFRSSDSVLTDRHQEVRGVYFTFWRIIHIY